MGEAQVSSKEGNHPEFQTQPIKRQLFVKIEWRRRVIATNVAIVTGVPAESSRRMSLGLTRPANTSGTAERIDPVDRSDVRDVSDGRTGLCAGRPRIYCGEAPWVAACPGCLPVT